MGDKEKGAVQTEKRCRKINGIGIRDIDGTEDRREKKIRKMAY